MFIKVETCDPLLCPIPIAIFLFAFSKSQCTARSSIPDGSWHLICPCFYGDRSLHKMKSYHARWIAIPSHAENNFGIDAKGSFVNRHLFEIDLRTRRNELSHLLSSGENSCLDHRTCLKFVVEMTLSNLALLSFFEMNQ